MIEVNEGKLPWVGERLTCHICGAVVELEEHDDVSLSGYFLGLIIIGIECPTTNCPATIQKQKLLNTAKERPNHAENPVAIRNED